MVNGFELVKGDIIWFIETLKQKCSNLSLNSLQTSLIMAFEASHNLHIFLAYLLDS